MINNVQKLREALLLNKAELARRAGLSTLTIDRVEKGRSCRMETKRKIILALGFNLADKEVVFGDRQPDAESLAEAASRLSEWEEVDNREEDEETEVINTGGSRKNNSRPQGRRRSSRLRKETSGPDTL